MKLASFRSLESEPATMPGAFPPLTRNLVAAILLLTFLGLGLRFCRLSSQSLWQDEIGSIVASEAPLEQMYEYSTKINNCLPTYSLLLSIIFPPDAHDFTFVGRAVSALAGGLSIPLFIAVVYFWRNRQGAALLAGLLLAINPLHIWYSQEMRPYALVLVFGLLTLLFFELARLDPKNQSRWWGLYLCSGGAAALLHKTGLIFPWLCILWHGRQVLSQSKPFKALSIHLPLALLSLVLLLLKSYPPGESYARGRSILEIAYAFPAFLGGYSFGPSITSIQTVGPLAAALQNLPQLGILGLVLLLVVAGYALNFRALLFGRETHLLVLDLGIVAAYSVIFRFPFNVRYALPALLGFLALLSLFITQLPHRTLARSALVPVFVLALWADVQWFYTPAYGKADTRGVVQWLIENKERVRSWTVLPGYFNYGLRWYLWLSDNELMAREVLPVEDLTTSFPPVPDVLIMGRRHHIIEPDKIVAAYHAAAGPLRTNLAFVGYQVYLRKDIMPERGAAP